MKLLATKKLAGIASVLGVTVFANLAAASSPLGSPASELVGKRLIQSGWGQEAWMSEREIFALSQKAHLEGHCGGFKDITDHQDKIGMTEASRQMPLSAFTLLSGLEPSHPTEVARVLPELSAELLRATVAKLSSYKNRYYTNDTGVEAAQWIADQFKEIGKARSDISVATFTHKFKQPSVIARIQGNDPQLAGEKIVLGAHLDSINWNGFMANPNGVAPGADDDATGIATLIETYRVLVKTGFQPARTIEFMGYAGEEKGLLGSQDIAQAYKKKGEKVVAVLQMDMTGYPSKSKPAITMISDDTNPELTRFVEQIMDTYVKVQWNETKCGYSCSDHASWTDAGYASAFPFEAPIGQDNQDIHTPRDTIEKLDFQFGLHFAKITAAFAVELGLKK